MASARSFYRLAAGVGAAALLAIALAFAVVVRAIDFRHVSLGDIAEACRRALVANLDLASVLVLILGSVSFAVLLIGLRSLARQLRARRRFLRRVRVIGAVRGYSGKTLLIDDARPLAFCAGYLRPRIYVSTAALAMLDDDELEAVLAHEEHHARRRDPLRVLLTEVLGDALFFLPVMRQLRKRYGALAEIAADEAAVNATGDPAPLASAMLAFGGTSQAGVVGIAPERVDHLLGERPRWELPVSLLAGGLITVIALLVFVASASQTAGSGQLTPAALTAQACMVVMTIFPILLGAGLLLVTKRLLTAAKR